MECPVRVRSAGCTAPQSRGAAHLDTRADYSARPRVATRGLLKSRARSGPASIFLRAPPSLNTLGPGPRGPRRTRGRCLRFLLLSCARAPTARWRDFLLSHALARASTPSTRRQDGIETRGLSCGRVDGVEASPTGTLPREQVKRKDAAPRPSSASLSFRISGSVSFRFSTNSSRYTRALSAAAAAMRASRANASAILFLRSLSSANCIKYCCAFFAACAAANRSFE